ncbi:glutathione S-transferase family protein [Variovorax sp. RA8]|uniref:glutathione S-transferase family protein n=1 Tax=Variovorax sp. (strain JCM 16519 / RA8) TaxID=662548 RepID=UPI0013194995|nr:glutathione S-transferase [Variovorax sp. RA8]VTU31876.1 Disulfide-bond oxidoreductase YfcG [Variovorax sp. RA8]
MIKLYNDELSGNCYKLRLFMSLLQLPYARVPVNFHPGREHKGEAFLRINPLGQLPAIDDDGYVLRDAQAILVYLASRYDRSERWYPAEAATRGRIALWLAVAEDITRSASAARLHDAFGYPFDIAACRGAAHRLFAHIEDHLSDGEIEGRTWLAAHDATIADIACFPYIALAPEGGVGLERYPALRRWIARLKALPNFVGMPGIFAAGIDPEPS